MRLRILLAVSAIAFVAVAGLAVAAAPPPIFVDGHGVAISGYDVVSYFEGRAPLKGKASWKATFQGAEFRFASKQNLDRFRAEPEKFVPQFGGYCAWKMSRGMAAKCDPRRFSLKDGRLYLFSSEAMRESWESDHSQLIAKAVGFWRDLLQN